MAQVYNVLSLAAAAFFVVYSWLIIFDQGPLEFTHAVMRTYVLSLVLSFLCNDVAVCALVALLPTASKKSHRILNLVATVLLAILGPDDD